MFALPSLHPNGVPAGPDEDRPTRFNESFSDKFVDQMPAKVWPIARVPFFIISALYLVLVFAGFRNPDRPPLRHNLKF